MHAVKCIVYSVWSCRVKTCSKG